MAAIEKKWLFLVFIRSITPQHESQWTVVAQNFSKINSKTSLLILFYIEIFPTPTFMEQVFFRNCHFLPHFFLKNLDVLTISWTFYIVTSIKFLQIWNLQDLSFHLTPSLHSLTKIENWPKIWKWNAKAIKHKWFLASEASESLVLNMTFDGLILRISCNGITKFIS